jgi:hypothetical protein
MTALQAAVCDVIHWLKVQVNLRFLGRRMAKCASDPQFFEGSTVMPAGWRKSSRGRGSSSFGSALGILFHVYS